MADEVLLYISAAPDLEIERAVLSRAVIEIPVTLGWRIVQSPNPGEPTDLEAVSRADIHLLLLGSDIRAPVGTEWAVARRSGRTPALFLKKGALRTPAALEFTRTLAEVAAWRDYQDSADLRHQVLQLISGQILERAVHFALRPAEYEQLQEWREKLEASGKEPVEETRGGTGESSVILTRERYVPSEGVLIKTPKQDDARRGRASSGEDR